MLIDCHGYDTTVPQGGLRDWCWRQIESLQEPSLAPQGRPLASDDEIHENPRSCAAQIHAGAWRGHHAVLADRRCVRSLGLNPSVAGRHLCTMQC